MSTRVDIIDLFYKTGIINVIFQFHEKVDFLDAGSMRLQLAFGETGMLMPVLIFSKMLLYLMPFFRNAAVVEGGIILLLSFQ